MSADAKVKIPNHVATDKLFKVVCKIMGTHEEKVFLGDNKIKDASGACTNKNSWIITFESKLVTVNYPMLMLTFQNKAEDQFGWFLHLENEDEEDYKMLSARSNPLFLAVGKRVVDFFSGELVYTDSYDRDDSYINNNPKITRKKETESSNDRFYQFYNLLNEEPLITAKEIEDMKEFSSYPKEPKSQYFIDFLMKYETYIGIKDKLDNEAPIVSKIPKNKI